MTNVSVFITIGVPIAVALLRIVLPRHPATGYLIPRFLNEPEHTCIEIRQSGVGWMVAGIWLLSLPFAVGGLLPIDLVESNRWFMGFFMFVIPVTAVILHIAGWLLFLQGIFTRRERVRPIISSVIDPEDRDE